MRHHLYRDFYVFPVTHSHLLTYLLTYLKKRVIYK